MEIGTKRRVRAHIARVHSAFLRRGELIPTIITCQISLGMPNVRSVGIGAHHEKELIIRLAGAFASCGVRFPTRRTIFSIDPPLVGAGDAQMTNLAFALAYLLASKELQPSSALPYFCLGALQIDGNLLEFGGNWDLGRAFSNSDQKIHLIAAGTKALFSETQLMAGSSVIKSLQELFDRFKNPRRGRESLFKMIGPGPKSSPSAWRRFSQSIDSSLVKRAATIAMAGSHHLLLAGPPGSGKSLLASLIPEILPDLNSSDWPEILATYRSAQMESPLFMPFREPLASCTRANLIGHAQSGQPGDLALAHGGVLHVGECLEWDRKSLEILRQPLESGCIEARGKGGKMPARFLMVATTNLCPCGLKGHPSKLCRCNSNEIRRYQRVFSHALMDRVPLRVSLGENGRRPKANHLPELAFEDLVKARKKMLSRQGCANEWANVEAIEQGIPLNPRAEEILDLAQDRYAISFRGRQSIIKVAATIADLANIQCITDKEVSEALYFRRDIFAESLDWRQFRENFGETLFSARIQ